MNRVVAIVHSPHILCRLQKLSACHKNPRQAIAAPADCMLFSVELRNQAALGPTQLHQLFGSGTAGW